MSGSFMEYHTWLESAGLGETRPSDPAIRWRQWYCPHCGIARMPHLFQANATIPADGWPRPCPECGLPIDRPYVCIPDDQDEGPWARLFRAWAAAYPDQPLTIEQVEAALYSTLRDVVPP
jgi:hypothetical protein